MRRGAAISTVQATVFVTEDQLATETVTLDAFDHHLLELVRRDTLQPARILAKTVGLSESAVLRRLRRLRAEGVIVADVAVLDPARLGAAITLHVLVEMERERAMAAFAEVLRERPEVLGAWQVTGRTDFLLTLAVPSMEAYDAFIRDVLSDERQVRTFQTLVTLREVVRFDPRRAPLAF
ncbi:AsnC family transcriptional regulator [Caulobacter sp. Root655]|nr:AsnC family transcriptional regulator [Caulobacter sp. Root655]